PPDLNSPPPAPRSHATRRVPERTRARVLPSAGPLQTPRAPVAEPPVSKPSKACARRSSSTLRAPNLPPTTGTKSKEIRPTREQAPPGALPWLAAQPFVIFHPNT